MIKINEEIFEEIEKNSTEYEEKINKELKELNEIENEITNTFNRKNIPLNISKINKFEVERIETNNSSYLYLTFNGCLLPVDNENVGEERFLFGDFHTPVEYMNFDELIEFSRGLNVYLKELNENIKEMNKKLDKVD